jgi:RHS repeat-associated protein
LTYDDDGNLESVEDPLSHETTVTMNPDGQVASVTDPLSHTWQFGYVGGDLASTTDPLSRTQTRFVDAGGRVVATTDPLGRMTQTVSDKLNRVTSVADARGAQTAFAYDANSNLAALTDALSHTTAYAYDDDDRVETRTDPLTNDDMYGYDAQGNLTGHTDRKGQDTTYTYDALGRLVLVTYDDSSTTTYTYDAGNRLIEIDDSIAGVITREYDGLDRLTEETTPEGTVTYTYDDDGRRATMTVSGQDPVEYTYDAAHRLTAITQDTAAVALTYDDADRRSTLTYPNGIVVTYDYDGANQLTSLSYDLGMTNLGTLTYTYDAAGNRTSVGGTWARTGLPSALASATYDAANRLTSWGGTAFTYDDNGNLIDDGPNTYTWNARNQLTGISGGVSASFAYDGAGRRRAKTISSTTTQFLYDGLNFVQELTGGTPTANLLTGLGPDETFTRALSGGTSTLLADALGSTVALANGSGTIQTEYAYQPFGAPATTGTSNTNSQQFTGREDDGTGLVFYHARYLNPATSRFISEDPLDFDDGANLFQYVGNNPIRYIDPSGTIKGERNWEGNPSTTLPDGTTVNKRTKLDDINNIIKKARDLGISDEQLRVLKGIRKIIKGLGAVGVAIELLDPIELISAECPFGPGTCKPMDPGPGGPTEPNGPHTPGPHDPTRPPGKRGPGKPGVPYPGPHGAPTPGRK